MNSIILFPIKFEFTSITSEPIKFEVISICWVPIKFEVISICWVPIKFDVISIFSTKEIFELIIKLELIILSGINSDVLSILDVWIICGILIIYEWTIILEVTL